MSIVSLINQIESHEEAVQSILQRIESLVEHICGIAGENRPTGAKFPMEIIDL